MRYLLVLCLLLCCAVSAGAQRHVTLDWSKMETVKEKLHDSGYIIDGPIKDLFSGIVIEDTADFTRATFSEVANFYGATFSKEAYFPEATFSKDAGFLFATFSKKAYFPSATFSKKAYFPSATFSKEANFTKATFSKEAFFTLAAFERHGDFSEATFSEEAKFPKATFINEAYFSFAAFAKEADFQEAAFAKEADFHQAAFAKEANFSGATFSKKADFSDATFSKKADFTHHTLNSARFTFDHTHLPDTIDFADNPHIQNEINLQLAQFDENSALTRNEGFIAFWKKYFRPWRFNNADIPYRWINLYNTEIPKLKMDYLHFRLYFKDIFALRDSNLVKSGKLNKLESESLPPDKRASIYQTLLKNFRNHGQTESIKALDIEYQYFRHDNSLIAYVQDWWWRFGYEKWRIFIHIPVFLLLFSFITFFFVRPLHRRVYSLDAIAENEKSASPGRNEHWRFGKRFWYAFIYTTTIFFAFSLKIDKLKMKPGFWNILATLYVVLVSAVGLLCLGYVANFVLQK